MSVDLSAQQKRQQQQQQQQQTTTTNKLPVRKTVSVHPTGNINNGIPKDNSKPVGQLKKFNVRIWSSFLLLLTVFLLSSLCFMVPLTRSRNEG
jgi:hypothetical protein